MEQYQVGALRSIFYIPEFVDAAQEQELIRQIDSAPRTKWKQLKNRRLQYWGGMVHEKGMISEPVPQWLQDLMETIVDKTQLFPAPLNHILINEYLPGQGIMAHQDGPLYFPVVAILSLGSPAFMRFTRHKDSAPEEAFSKQALPKQPPHVASQMGGFLPETASEATSVKKDEDRIAADRVDCLSNNPDKPCWPEAPPSLLLPEKVPHESADEASTDSSREDQTEPCSSQECSLVLMPRSLLIFKDEAYTDCLHGIDEKLEHVIDGTVVNLSPLRGDSGATALKEIGGAVSSSVLARQGRRLSLTCRQVLKVRKAFIHL